VVLQAGPCGRPGGFGRAEGEGASLEIDGIGLHVPVGKREVVDDLDGLHRLPARVAGRRPRRQFLCRAASPPARRTTRGACYPRTVASVPEPPAVGQPARLFSLTSVQGGTAGEPTWWCGSPAGSRARSAGSTWTA